MRNLDIIIPVKNEQGNILPLIERIGKAMKSAKIPYKIIFIDDHSTDKTFELLNKLKFFHPILVYRKIGKVGKAFSILEGVRHSNSEFVVMLDADLQYPPEAIPEMYAKAFGHGIVVGNRKDFEASKARKFISRAFNFGFGRVLHGFKVDVQSGLKLFRREILEYIDEKEITPWTLDLSLLNTARNLGFKITGVNIKFSARADGNSKVDLIKTAAEIGKNALKLKFRRKKTYLIKPVSRDTMAGAGFIHNKKWLRTHTTLRPHKSALQPFTFTQVAFFVLVLIALGIGFILSPFTTLVSIVGVLSFVYFFDVLFNLYIVLKSLHYPPEIISTDKEIAALKDEDLPIYTILCPLYREAHMIPDFLDAISKLNYPKSKLDVKLLLEEDDEIAVDAVRKMALPKYVSTIVIPDSEPKTKPKACNYGLNFAAGEYLVIYDAEDQPEPDQLKKAYLAFKKSKPNIVCLQAKLNYFNPHQNLLTRFFTAEYSLWFDVMLTGLQSVDTVIPLGGTSNHFRTKTLLELEGWDPFNVTEDCDLGVRLFKHGYKTAIIDSTTLEEANSNPKNWLRQRSRWIKGYMQTYLVHMRNPFEFVRQNGWHALVFQLIIGARISFMLINPILWATTFAYFVFYAHTAAFIESLYPSIVFYFAVFSLIAGNFLYIYNYMIGSAKKEHWGLMKYIFLIPIYWLMSSVASVIALYQLIVKPHYWEKTIHGLHLIKKIEKVKVEVKEEYIPQVTKELAGIPWFKRIRIALSIPAIFTASIVFILASLTAGLMNLGFNVYVGRLVGFEDLALVTLINGFFYFSNVPQAALFSTITHRIAFLEGKGKKDLIPGFLNQTTKRFLLLSYILSGIWMFSIPWLTGFFNAEDILPFILFAPVWTFGIAGAISKGFLSGKLLFKRLSIVLLTEPAVKLAGAAALISLGYSSFVYSVIPLAIVISFFVALFLASNFLKTPKTLEVQKKESKFPLKFYLAASLAILAPMSFLSMDVLLATHFLSGVDAGKYALVALIGKIIFFLGILVPQLINPIVSRNEGANKNSNSVLSWTFLATFIFTGIGFLFWGIFGSITAPIVFGNKVLEVIPFLIPFTFAMVSFSLSQIFVSFYLAKKIYTFPIISFLLSFVQIGLIYINHQSVEAIVWDMFLISLFNLVVMSLLHFFVSTIKVFESNLADFFGLLSSSKEFDNQPEKKLRVLVLNWRDTKHVWAGGAEAYLHELSKVWVLNGVKVTLFCGNDGKHERNEVIDGVQIVRRGGFYTVYIWAFLYYVIKFRGKFDAVIESANGIPFFTPFYVGKPKLLLIHHIHQEVFREHLPFGLSHFARFLEGTLMPMVYKNKKVVTISESTKGEILKLKFSANKLIDIVNPGVAINDYRKMAKTAYPSFLYLGRLQPYKNVDVAMKAFSRVVRRYPEARFLIAGFGEALVTLQRLTKQLNIENNVEFLGRVSEEKKIFLMAKSWVMVQPSMIEGWGITVIEANASGTPVIASNVNGLRDSVVNGKTGLLVKPKDVDMFAKAMFYLIKNPNLRDSLSKEAYRWAQNFDWGKSASKFLSIIEDDISSKSLNQIILRRLSLEI